MFDLQTFTQAITRSRIDSQKNGILFGREAIARSSCASAVEEKRRRRKIQEGADPAEEKRQERNDRQGEEVRDLGRPRSISRKKKVLAAERCKSVTMSKSGKSSQKKCRKKVLGLGLA